MQLYIFPLSSSVTDPIGYTGLLNSKALSIIIPGPFNNIETTAGFGSMEQSIVTDVPTVTEISCELTKAGLSEESIRLI